MKNTDSNNPLSNQFEKFNEQDLRFFKAARMRHLDLNSIIKKHFISPKTLEAQLKGNEKYK